MREIKFRGKTPTGEWKHGDLWHDSDGQPFVGTMEDGHGEAINYEVAPATVGQFTGLLDKHGVEIYEGDILMKDGCWPKMVCKYKNGAFVVDYCAMHLENMDNYEVIGNIHDNPDLPKGAPPCSAS